MLLKSGTVLHVSQNCDLVWFVRQAWLLIGFWCYNELIELLLGMICETKMITDRVLMLWDNITITADV